MKRKPDYTYAESTMMKDYLKMFRIIEEQAKLDEEKAELAGVRVEHSDRRWLHIFGSNLLCSRTPSVDTLENIARLFPSIHELYVRFSISENNSDEYELEFAVELERRRLTKLIDNAVAVYEQKILSQQDKE